MKNKIVLFLFFVSIIFFAAILPKSVSAIICHSGYIQGNVPATQIPDYSYTDDGFLELHFRLTDANWKYNYDRVIQYDSNCNIVGGSGEWGVKRSWTWPGVTHLLIRFSDGSPEFPGRYHANIYDGDTGEIIILNDNSMLSYLSRTYSLYSNRPVIRFVFGNRVGENGTIDFNTETGDLISSPALPVKITVSKNPVLIIPGLMGTEMEKEEELLWPDVARMINPFNTDNFMDPLQFRQNLTSPRQATHAWHGGIRADQSSCAENVFCLE